MRTHPHSRGTLVFRINRIPQQDPAHELVTLNQLEALRALLGVSTDSGVR